MRIGIVCEGATDALAIEHFLAASMHARDTQVEFVRLQPEKDHTQGGWTNVLLWLENNPPQSRVSAYFQGIFQGEQAAKGCDMILVHLDSDVLSRQSFREYMPRRHQCAIDDPDDPRARGAQTSLAVESVARLAELTAVDVARHIAAPAVESTETWCVGVFHQAAVTDVEMLKGDDLRDAFMTVLHRSESRPDSGPYAQIDKSVSRRRRFCQKHAGGFGRLEAQCYHYRRLVSRLCRPDHP